MKFKVYLLCALLLIGILVAYSFRSEKPETNGIKNNPIVYPQVSGELKPYELSGWISYWDKDEEHAYQMLKKRDIDLKTVSPLWYLIDSSFEITEVGTSSKKGVVTELSKKYRIIPTMAHTMTRDELTDFLSNRQAENHVLDTIIAHIENIKADGLDIDLENIEEKNREKYNEFLQLASEKLHSKNLKLVIDASARTGHANDWDGALGHDYAFFGHIADEVRLMAYDLHGPGSIAGPITSGKWLQDVLQYAVTYIPKEKIVVGFPTYAYIWKGESTEAISYPYNDFMRETRGATSSIYRHGESQALHFTIDDREGWGNDKTSIEHYMRVAQSFGLNQFILWHLGGMDEELFHSS
jgi:spore germination protein